MPQVSFNNNLDLLRVPLSYAEFDNSRALSGPGTQEFNILFIGQRLATGQVDAAVPTRIFSPEHAEQAFGVGSHLAQMIRAFKLNNSMMPTYAIALDDDDVGGVAATGKLAFSIGESGLSVGTLPIWIAGTRLRLAVTSTDTEATIATKVIALINASPRLPVVAGVVPEEPAQVKLTCRWKGDTGNDIDLRTLYRTEDRVPLGLTVAITPMADGAGNPDVTPALAALGDTWWKVMVVGYADSGNIATLLTELGVLWGPISQKDAMAFVGFRGDGSVGASATFGETPNSQLLTVMPSGKAPTTPWELAAIDAGASVGSMQSRPARPLQTLPLIGFLPPLPGDRFIFEDRNNLLFDGCSTYKVDSAGNAFIERQITTYRTNVLGSPDESYLNVETPMTLSYMRWSQNAYIDEMFPRCSLMDDPTDGSFPVAEDVVTPSILKAAVVTLARTRWVPLGIVQDIDAFEQALIVVIDPQNPRRANMLLQPKLVNQFNIFAAQIQFLLQ